MSGTSRAKVQRDAFRLMEELRTRLGRELTIEERRAAFLVVRAPTKAAKRLYALTERAELAGDGSDRVKAETEAAALETAFSGAVRCVRCGHALSDPESVRLGIGPDCRLKARA